MNVHFTKMHGLGNDYIYIDCFKIPAETLPDPARLAVCMSPRHTAVGADGLVLILPSAVADARMRMFNADGSEGLMCGNAIRCVGKYLVERGLLPPDTRRVTVETATGVRELILHGTDGCVTSVTVDMGRAFVEDEELRSADGVEYALLPVSVGNPHMVAFVADVASVDVAAAGKLLSACCSGGVNVEFAELLGDGSIRMRVYERGSGVTQACGTGACATVAAAVARGFCRTDTDVTVLLDGGALCVTCTSDGRLRMTGPAEISFDGVWKV